MSSYDWCSKDDLAQLATFLQKSGSPAGSTESSPPESSGTAGLLISDLFMASGVLLAMIAYGCALPVCLTFLSATALRSWFTPVLLRWWKSPKQPEDGEPAQKGSEQKVESLDGVSVGPTKLGCQGPTDQERCEALEHLISSLERDLAAANQDVDRGGRKLELRIAEQRRQLKVLQAEKARDSELLKKQAVQIKSLKSDNVTLRQNMKSQRTSTGKTEKDLREQLKKQTRRVSELERLKSTLDSKITDAEKLKSKLTSDAEKLKSKLASVTKAGAAKARTELEAAKRESAKLKKENVKLQKKVESATATRKANKAKLDTAKRDVKSKQRLEKQVAQLRSQLAMATKQSTQLCSKVEADKDKSDLLKSEHFATKMKYKSEIEELRNALGNRDAESQQFQQALSQTRNYCRQEAEKRAILEAKLRNEEAEVKILRVELAEAQSSSQIGGLTEAAVLRAKVTQLRRRSKRETAAMRELQEHLWAAENQIRNMMDGESSFTAFGPCSNSKRGYLQHGQLTPPAMPMSASRFSMKDLLSSELDNLNQVFHARIGAPPSKSKRPRYNPWVIPARSSQRLSGNRESNGEGLPSSKVDEVRAFFNSATEPSDEKKKPKEDKKPGDDDKKPTTTNLEAIQAIFSARDPPPRRLSSMSLTTNSANSTRPSISSMSTGMSIINASDIDALSLCTPDSSRRGSFDRRGSAASSARAQFSFASSLSASVADELGL